MIYAAPIWVSYKNLLRTTSLKFIIKILEPSEIVAGISVIPPSDVI